ncbi:uncharacterized protein LOC131217661 [Magnolia sinica]|uniref:uncharacterized protein LOC131217661 n=1 Tax=Magnolia sinica TaxID=86752 RepID=UPI002658D6DC|nr:uncharacterized protein LOC131217661 [Magnolia sinica]
MCIDFRDLNKARPKDDFPLPHIDTLVDNTAGHKIFSFMDGFSGYNQIKMVIEDREKTSFITPWETFCYQVMPFGLKNAGATYQRVMTALFHNMINKEMEVYVDDMIVKSRTIDGHFEDLENLFNRLEKFKLRLNPQKCVFGATGGKLLGFIVSEDGIRVDETKTKAIIEIPPPKTEKKIRGFLGQIQYISRFIAQLTSVCEPIFKLLWKNSPKELNDDCQAAFDKIKKYLLNPPVLMPLTPGRPLLLYISVAAEAIGYVLGQHDDTGRKEQAIYYLSLQFISYEAKYSSLEKTCLALVWATQRLRHYMIAHPILLLARMNPLKYLFEKPALTGRIAKWQLLLSEFSITYVTQKVIKGQTLADHLAAHSLPDYQPLKTFFFDEDILLIKEEEGRKAGEWTLFFNGAINSKGSGVGDILYSPEDVPIPISRRLAFQCTNYVAEYEACIASIRETIILNVKKLGVFGDSQLIINQINGDWKTKDEKLIPYHVYLENLAEEFEEITFSYMPRIKNQFVDALATLPLMLEIPKGVTEWELTVELQEEPAFCLQIDEAEPPSNDQPWYMDIKKYLEHQKYQEGAMPVDRRTIQWLAAQFVITGGILYKRSFNQVLLRCVDETEAAQIMVPQAIITDNGTPSINKRMGDFLDKFKIQRHRSSPYRPQMNSGVEAANKAVIRILEKMSATGATPYELVYGMEAVLPVEIEIPSLPILLESEVEEGEWQYAKYDQLHLVDEKRM